MGKTYSTSQAARKVNRSIQTLMSWEAEGLITPGRDDRGWRVWTDQDIDILEEIKKQKLSIKLGGKGGEVDVQ